MVLQLFRGIATASLLQCAALAQPGFHFPTPNQLLLDPPQPERFFAPTPGRTWESGSFGCVRSEGTQLHEGIDILFTQQDRRGEPTDSIFATAPGTVAYVNRRAGTSNYGKYLILYHTVEGIEFYSLYAHLSSIDDRLEPGRVVPAGYTLGVMGRTTNTRQPIGKHRAHLHFEIGFLVNEHFPRWLKERFPGQRNDHGLWNGRNLFAIDPARVFQTQASLGAQFRFLDHLRQQTEHCRVLVRQTQFPWVNRYSRLVEPNPRTQQEGIAGYELSLNLNGVPFRLVPRTAAELEDQQTGHVIAVNEEEVRDNPCRRLVQRRGSAWQLAPAGTELLSLLTYAP